MKDYVRWSLTQFYWLLFWPSKFEQEVEDIAKTDQKLSLDQRVGYQLKLLPWIVFLVCLYNLLMGNIIEGFGEDYNWFISWCGVAFGVAFGVVLGVALGVAGGVAFGVAVGVALGVAGGVAFGVALDVADGVAWGVAFGVAGGTAFGVVWGVTRGVVWPAVWPAVFGVVWGVAVGVAFGVAVDVAVGTAAGTALSVVFELTYLRLPSFLRDGSLTSCLFWISRRSPSGCSQVWRWHPLAWNEVLWLPLPYVGKYLALYARQNRTEAQKRFLFILKERSLQRRAVQYAVLETSYDDLQADSVDTIATAADRMAWYFDIPLDLNSEWQTGVEYLERISRRCDQALTVDNLFRRRELLKQVVEELETLQKTLAFTPGSARVLARFQQTAEDWKSVVQTEVKRQAELAERDRLLPNPFLFGDPVNERHASVFTGRRDIVRKIEENLLGAGHAPTLLLHGPRRMGKTSVLMQLPRLLGPSCAVALSDCENPACSASSSSPASLLAYFSRRLSEGLASRRVELQPLDRDTLREEPFAEFDDWLGKAESQMGDSVRLLWCVDEYERLQRAVDSGWGEEVLDFLRHVVQHRRQLTVLFSGSRTFEELGPTWTDRFISARRLRVGRLSREEVIPLLTHPIPDFGLAYADGALDDALDATVGQPYLTQAVGYELVQWLNEQKRHQATCEDIQQAIGQAIESGSAYFHNVWFDAGEDGQAILRAAAAGESPPTAPRAFRWLREHEVLDKSHNFISPMFRMWVEKEWLSDR